MAFLLSGSALGGEGVCLGLGQTGTGRLSCACITEFCPEKEKRKFSSVLEHLHAGLRLCGGGWGGGLCVFERTVPKYRLFFFVMLIFVNRSLVPISRVKPRPVECAFGSCVHFYPASIFSLVQS